MLTFHHSGTLAASFGVFAGTAALFMFGEVPRVRRDILQKFPFLDTYFDRTIAPEDNVSSLPLIFLLQFDAVSTDCLDSPSKLFRFGGQRATCHCPGTGDQGKCRIVMKVFYVLNSI